jgi:peptidoglycan/xylan/chitin deacetylase (PgdA/CDA1 family)
MSIDFRTLRSTLYSLFLLACMWPVQAAFGQDHGVILLYHHVDSSTPPSTSISPEDFRGHLEYLRDNDFSVIGLDTMVERLRNHQAIPDKSVAITFDDGYSSIYDTAFPMLQEFGFPFTLFVSTGPINDSQRGYMNWQQISEMSDAGVVIANHMVEHPYMLEKLQGEDSQQWISRLRDELLQAEAEIRQQTDQSHRYLAYPYGEYAPIIVEMLSELDFTGFAQNSGAISSYSDFLALPRFPLASIYANLQTAKTKFETKAFNVEKVEPLSPVTTERNPTVTLKFEPGAYRFSQIGCFANSEPLQLDWLDVENGILKISGNEEYGGRRWRYICTAPDPQSNRFYWNSVQWIKTD